MARSVYRCKRCGGSFASYRDASSHYTTVHTKGQTSGKTIEPAKQGIVKE